MQPKAKRNNTRMSLTKSGSIKLIFSAIIFITDSAVSLLVVAKIPTMNKKTCFSSSLNLSSFTTESQSIPPSRICQAR